MNNLEEEIEELYDEDVEIEAVTRLDLLWTCPECKSDNVEYNVTADGVIDCVCDKCNKKYTYYNCMY